MTQQERRLYLIRSLLEEDRAYQSLEIPRDEHQQAALLRSLMNVRMPKPISREFLRIQDAYLSAERDKNGITDSDALPVFPGYGRISLWQGDITTLRVDAIINAANSGMCGCFHPMHSCIDNIIHSRSGIQLRLTCDELMRRQGHAEPTGQAKITPAYNLPSRYILHTVGPIVTGRVSALDCDLLASCYRSCLELAAQNSLRSIAFCCISTGEFHFPNEKAAEIAIQTVSEFLSTNTTIQKVIFNVFKDLDRLLYERLLRANRRAAAGI